MRVVYTMMMNLHNHKLCLKALEMLIWHYLS